jgi:hypothetical protein
VLQLGAMYSLNFAVPSAAGKNQRLAFIFRQYAGGWLNFAVSSERLLTTLVKS